MDDKPQRGWITSDGTSTERCTCGGAVYVFYDEDRLYRAECESCGTVVTFKAPSMDQAILIWNDIRLTLMAGGTL